MRLHDGCPHLGELCRKHFNGGGHAQAAGFVNSVPPFELLTKKVVNYSAEQRLVDGVESVIRCECEVLGLIDEFGVSSGVNDSILEKIRDFEVACPHCDEYFKIGNAYDYDVGFDERVECSGFVDSLRVKCLGVFDGIRGVISGYLTAKSLGE